MSINPIGMAGIFCAFLFFAGSYQLLHARQRSTRIKLLIIFAVLSVPSVMFAAYYLHIVPDTEAFYEFRSWPGTELSAAFAGGTAGILATFLPCVLRIVPLFLMAGIVSAPYVKPVIGPLPDKAFKNAWRGTVCLQSTSSTCGPASVATVMRQFGIPVSEMEVARGAYSYRRGTEAWYLARYLRRRGLNAHFRFEKGFCPDIELPAVAGVRLGFIGHFIALLGCEGDDYIIGEPLGGQERLTKEELLRRYGFTGFYLIISKE